MFSIKLIKLAAIILTLAFAPSALAQATTPSPEQSAKQSPDPSVRLGLKNRVFEIKHRDPDSLLSVLRLLGSQYGAMSVSNEFRTLTVRDFPENIATIDEAIKRLDTPVPSAPGMEFHIHILIASNAAAASNQYPSEISDVVKQLQSTLSYKNYYLMTSAVLRTKEGPQGIDNKGVADFKVATEGAARNSPIFYDYAARNVSLDAAASGARLIQIGVFNFAMRIPIETSTGQINYESIGFKTPVSVREGEKVVVGTTTMQDKGVIVVLTAKIIK